MTCRDAKMTDIEKSNGLWEQQLHGSQVFDLALILVSQIEGSHLREQKKVAEKLNGVSKWECFRVTDYEYVIKFYIRPYSESRNPNFIVNWKWQFSLYSSKLHSCTCLESECQVEYISIKGKNGSFSLTPSQSRFPESGNNFRRTTSN